MPAESTPTPAEPAKPAKPVADAATVATAASDRATSKVPRRTYATPAVILGFLALVALLLATDLGIKSWAFEHVAGVPVVLDSAHPFEPNIPQHQPRVVVPHVLSLWLTTNTGAVFGSAKGAKPLFVTVSILAVGVVSFLFLRSAANAYMFHLGLALVLSGALGNLYDRLMFSAVRDMFFLFPKINLPFGLAWPGGSTGVYPWIFNFADVTLVVGVVLLGLLSLYYDKQRQTAPKAQG